MSTAKRPAKRSNPNARTIMFYILDPGVGLDVSTFVTKDAALNQYYAAAVMSDVRSTATLYAVNGAGKFLKYWPGTLSESGKFIAEDPDSVAVKIKEAVAR